MNAAVEVAWFAGIFEGEGSIRIGTKQSKNTVRLTINMTDRDIIDRIDALYPTGHPVGVQVMTDHRKTQYIWRIGGTRRIRPILEAMLPWMGERRSARIREALTALDAQHPNGWLQAQKTHCKQGHEFTPENTAVRTDGKNRERRCRTCMRARAHRSRKKSTHCIRGHELTPENTYHSNRGRECKACKPIRAALRAALVASAGTPSSQSNYPDIEVH